MAGLNAVPQANQSFSSTQFPILQNFTTWIGPQFAVNHVGFNIDDTSGMHTQLDMILQSSAPTATQGGEILLYNFTSTSTTLPEIFIQRFGSTAYPLTASTAETYTCGGTPPIVASYTWSYFPSRLLMLCVLVPPNLSGQAIPLSIVFPSTPFPGFITAPFITGLWTNTNTSANTENDAAVVDSVTTTGFRLSVRSGFTSGTGFYFMAVGAGA